MSLFNKLKKTLPEIGFYSSSVDSVVMLIEEKCPKNVVGKILSFVGTRLAIIVLYPLGYMLDLLVFIKDKISDDNNHTPNNDNNTDTIKNKLMDLLAYPLGLIYPQLISSGNAATAGSVTPYRDNINQTETLLYPIPKATVLTFSYSASPASPSEMLKLIKDEKIQPASPRVA